MSGAKRRSQYRKGVTSHYDEELSLDTEDMLAKIKANKGSNIFCAELASGVLVTAKLPNKFHKVIWVKPGDIVVLDGMKEEEKVDVMNIKSILSKDTVKAMSKQQVLPESFQLGGDRKSSGYDMNSIMPAADEEEEGEYEEEGTMSIDAPIVHQAEDEPLQSSRINKI